MEDRSKIFKAVLHIVLENYPELLKYGRAKFLDIVTVVSDNFHCVSSINADTVYELSNSIVKTYNIEQNYDTCDVIYCYIEESIKKAYPAFYFLDTKTQSFLVYNMLGYHLTDIVVNDPLHSSIVFFIKLVLYDQIDTFSNPDIKYDKKVIPEISRCLLKANIPVTLERVKWLASDAWVSYKLKQLK